MQARSSISPCRNGGVRTMPVTHGPAQMAHPSAGTATAMWRGPWASVHEGYCPQLPSPPRTHMLADSIRDEFCYSSMVQHCLPPAGVDVLEVMENMDIFAACYAHSLHTQVPLSAQRILRLCCAQ